MKFTQSVYIFILSYTVFMPFWKEYFMWHIKSGAVYQQLAFEHKLIMCYTYQSVWIVRKYI